MPLHFKGLNTTTLTHSLTEWQWTIIVLHSKIQTNYAAAVRVNFNLQKINRVTTRRILQLISFSNAEYLAK